MSLPGFKAIGPVFGPLYKTGTNRILSDVIGRYLKAFVVTQSMIEKIALPSDVSMGRGISFPPLDCLLDSNISGESEEKMDVIGHEKQQMNEPFIAILIKS